MKPRVRYTLPRSLRITRTAEFQRVLDAGLRANDDRLTVWALPNGLRHPRLGLVVGRKHGGAVQRNRLKRLLREAFRLSQHELPTGLDFACSPRAGPTPTLPELRESLLRLAGQLARRLQSR
ncbi:MAG: ribonuclease P protein component [Planctomycetota bacterium]